MDIASVIAKAAAGESLSEEEKECLRSFPGQDSSAELEALKQERDAARAELAAQVRSTKVRELAEGSHFCDTGYLDYLLEKNAVPIEESSRTGKFLEELKNSSPRLFRVELKPGAAIPVQDRIPDTPRSVAELLAEAPEITR